MTEKQLKIFFKLRGYLMLPPMLFVLLSQFAECEEHVIVFPLGMTLLFLGVTLRFWSQLHLHYRLSVSKILTLTGPYAYVRNPIYIGNTLILIGLCAMSELLWFMPIMLVWCAVVYHFVVRYEETHLTQKYGELYLEFTKRVPRWLPKLSRVTREAKPDVRAFIMPSVYTELYNFIFILPFFLKELFTR